MENLATEGFSEKYVSMALDIFIRDAAFFEEEDLENPTFKLFLRELSQNIMTFQEEKNYVKTAQFLDWFCIEDPMLWVNLEQFVVKKERKFTRDSYVQLLKHFSN